MLKASAKLFKLAYQENRSEVRKHFLISITLEIISVLSLYYLNQVYGNLYAAIQVYDTDGIWNSIGIFTAIAMFLVLVNGYLSYFINRLAFFIREGLTTFYHKNEAIYNDMPLIGQRVQEDFRKFGESACEFWFAVFKAAMYLPVFLGVIISLTEWYIGLSIVGAVGLGTVITRIVAMRLVESQSAQESNEASYRQELTPDSFRLVRDQFHVINKLYKRLAFTQSGLSQIFVLLPFIVLMPMYLSKAITMGVFFQAVNALGKIIDSLSILIDSRQTMVNIETCLIRLSFFTSHL